MGLFLAEARRRVLRTDQRHCRRGNQQNHPSHDEAPSGVENQKAGVDGKVRIFPVNTFHLDFSDFLSRQYSKKTRSKQMFS
jgi:hypothetical protein